MMGLWGAFHRPFNAESHERFRHRHPSRHPYRVRSLLRRRHDHRRFLFLPTIKGASEAGAFADHLMARARLLIVVFVTAGDHLHRRWPRALPDHLGGRRKFGSSVLVRDGRPHRDRRRRTCCRFGVAGGPQTRAPCSHAPASRLAANAEQSAERDRLLRRLTWVTRLGAALLIVTISFMAIGLYA